MAGDNGTLFVSAYGEELVEPDECKVRVTITCECALVLEAQLASAETFEAIKKALYAAKIENETETIFFNVEKPKYYLTSEQRNRRPQGVY